MNWVCVQEGHREYYGIPRALAQAGSLERLITDVWAPPGAWIRCAPAARLRRRLRDRHHTDLDTARVSSFTARSLAWEAMASVRGLRGSRRVLVRNRWWDRLSARALRRTRTSATQFVFAYCYHARDLFQEARRGGLRPVLGQIDPGPVEDQKVSELVRRWPQYATAHEPGSAEYYARWREECQLAEHIVVNSDWSRSALVQAGIEERKIVVLPLAYVPPKEAAGWVREFPRAFTAARPLRVLFLGQCILRKGIAESIAAASMLCDRPVEFTLVGNTDITELERHFGRARIRHVPRVSRSECHEFFRRADVFLFPTHSDGFGLTQLEAQAWRLPIIASPFCGSVVEPDRTGWRLPGVDGAEIAGVIDAILGTPAALGARAAAIRPWAFGLDELGRRLTALAQAAERP